MLRTFCFSLYLISFSVFAEASFIDKIKVLTEEELASEMKLLTTEEDRHDVDKLASEFEKGKKDIDLAKDGTQADVISDALVEKWITASRNFCDKMDALNNDGLAIKNLLKEKAFKQAKKVSDRELSLAAADVLIDSEIREVLGISLDQEDDWNPQLAAAATSLFDNALSANANNQLESADERIALVLSLEVTTFGEDSPQRLLKLSECAEFYFKQLKDLNKAKQILAEAVRICDLCSPKLNDDEQFNFDKVYIYDSLADVAFSDRDFPLLTNYLEVFLETWPKSGRARSRWIDTREDDLEWIQKWFSKRNWTDLSGKFQITANLQEVKEGGEVILRTADKVDQVILLEQLSKQDQLFVNEFTNQFETPAKDNNPFKVVQNNPVEPMFVIDNNMAGDNPFAAPFAAPNMINFMEESNANEQKILELTKELNRKLGLVDEKLNSVSNLQNKLTEIDQKLSQLQAAGLASSHK